MISYYGEEIGMVNNMDITWEQTVDPSGCNCGIDEYNTEPCSRDPERTPMQWNDQTNAGFSEAEPWLPVNSNYLTLNVEAQQAAETSSLKIYQDLVELRKSDVTFQYGELETVVIDDVLAFSRMQEDSFYEVFVTAANFGEAETTVDLSQFSEFLPNGLVIVSSTGSIG